jgi:hypothetical protein
MEEDLIKSTDPKPSTRPQENWERKRTQIKDAFERTPELDALVDGEMPILPPRTT